MKNCVLGICRIGYGIWKFASIDCIELYKFFKNLCTLNVQKWEIEYIKYKNLCTLHKKLCSLNIEIKKFAYIEHTKSCVLFEKKICMLNLKFVYFESLNIMNSVR